MKLMKINHFREYIIAGVILIAGIVLGTIFDFDISKNLYSIENTNWFGILGSGIAELPIIIALAFGGAGLIVARSKESKFIEVVTIILGVAAIGFGLYYFFDTFCDIYGFKSTEDSKTLVTVFAVILSLLFNGSIVALVIIFGKKFDQKTLLIISLALVFAVLFIAVGENIVKYVISRPRPRYIFQFRNASDEYAPWHEIHFLKSIKEGDDFKSCPSGHSSYAVSAAFVLPTLTYLFPKTKDNNLFRVILFYAGLAWGLLFAFSRILAGAHFLSDVSIGMFLSLGFAYLAYLFVDKVFAKKIMNE